MHLIERVADIEFTQSRQPICQPPRGAELARPINARGRRVALPCDFASSELLRSHSHRRLRPRESELGGLTLLAKGPRDISPIGAEADFAISLRPQAHAYQATPAMLRPACCARLRGRH